MKDVLAESREGRATRSGVFIYLFIYANFGTLDHNAMCTTSDCIR